ncbi:nucleoside phosphorylase domain-containing protein [Cladorrhinum samala]|uniref:Nucleoside phosphorylase domain-containing protein n=1 Tax=Cladorrhinum samala TaxID=585594 RepID=A0AAV9HHA1_9PEZI|nr:nucleoside phosphorylase domain-containing protein [Cladorrhinum samala]
MVDQHDRPKPGRDGFEVAIICAIPFEASAVEFVIDEFWDMDGDAIKKAPGDQNQYRTGRIGDYNVVTTLLPEPGNPSAAAAIKQVVSYFPQVRLALVVGTCGAVPTVSESDEEIILGDVIISTSMVEVDYGTDVTDIFQKSKEPVCGALPEAAGDITSLLRSFETRLNRQRLHDHVSNHLVELQQADQHLCSRTLMPPLYRYRGASKDKLFAPTHIHRHRPDSAQSALTCACSGGFVCAGARRASCEKLRCGSGVDQIMRRRLALKKKAEKLETHTEAELQAPAVHFGAVASGDTNMRSAFHRNRLAHEHDIIAFEMEGAGPEISCLVIKGVSNYADGHRQARGWRDWGAATAAAACKAILVLRTRPEKQGELTPPPPGF